MLCDFHRLNSNSVKLGFHHSNCERCMEDQASIERRSYKHPNIHLSDSEKDLLLSMLQTRLYNTEQSYTGSRHEDQVIKECNNLIEKLKNM